MKTLGIVALLFLPSLAIAQRVTLDGYALRLSSIPIPKGATVASVVVTIRNGGVVVIRNLPAGWCAATVTRPDGETETTLSCYPYEFERTVVPVPVPLTDLDYTVLVRSPPRHLDDTSARPKLTIVGELEFLVPGAKRSQRFEFKDGAVVTVNGDE